MGNRTVLFVDDEVNVLDGYKRQLRKDFEVHTVAGGEYGLLINGVDFLSKVHERSPDMVRMMLSGNADMDMAIEAVNEGNIFRFMTKSSQTKKLIKAVEDGITQYELVMAEHELLKNTLTRSIQVLVEIFNMVDPMAFSRASRI